MTIAGGLLAMVMLAMSGCTMTGKQCKQADWWAIGYEDGIWGYPPKRFNDHVRTCTHARVEADATNWVRGHTNGLAIYCTPVGGLVNGALGHSYAGLCDAEKEPAFLSHFKLGWQWYWAKDKVSDLEAEISQARTDLSEKEDLIDETEDEGVRATLREEIRNLERDLWDDERELYEARREEEHAAGMFIRQINTLEDRTLLGNPHIAAGFRRLGIALNQ